MDAQQLLDKSRERIMKNTIRDCRPKWWMGWLNICPLNSAMLALRVKAEVWQGPAYTLLRSFHCQNYYAIPREVRRQIPSLIREVLSLIPEDKS